jgi:hypothetical protein
MKRGLVILILLIAIALVISSQQSFAKSITVACGSEGALRILANERSSKQGWPGEKLNDSTYKFEQLQYIASRTIINTTGLRLSLDERTYNGELIIEQSDPNSSRFTLQVIHTLPVHPLARIKNYFAIRQLKQTIQTMLAAFKNKFDGEQFVYGVKIERINVKDTAMISRRVTLNHYPTVAEIYEVVDTIQQYITTNGGTISNSPMLHIYEERTNQYLMMVAVPTQSPVAGNEVFLQKRMLANGFILVSEVVGGDANIKNGFIAMKQYITDYQKSSPAIPFQMLLTDRRKEADTAKWKTRLYFPIMY